MDKTKNKSSSSASNSANNLNSPSSASSLTGRNGRDMQRKPSKGRMAVASPIRTKSKEKIVGKSALSQVNRITNFPISIIIEDRLAFSSFISFCNDSHTSENVFFWCAAVSFREIGNTDGWERGLPRTPSWTIQEQIDAKESQWRGTSLTQVKALRESLAVYDRFIAPEAPNWVCLPLDIVKRIEATLDAARLAKKGKMPTLPYTIFQEAEKYAFLDMIHDILPRYLKQLAKDNDVKMMEYLKERMKERFNSSSIKISPADQANEMTKPETIANALSALYPSPRACLNNRPGSCLLEPINIKKLKEEEAKEKEKGEAKEKSSSRRGIPSIRGLFSRSSKSNEEKKKKETQEKEIEMGKARRNSTGSKGSLIQVSKESNFEDLVRVNSEASLGSQNDLIHAHTRSKSQ